MLSEVSFWFVVVGEAVDFRIETFGTSLTACMSRSADLPEMSFRPS